MRAYDFRRPTKLSREHVRAYEMCLETFCKQWSTLLTTTLRAVSLARLSSVEQLTYDEYVSTLPEETVMIILNADPFNGPGILHVSTSSAMTAIDHLLGGPGRAPQPERALSEIESTLFKGIVDRSLNEFRYAMESLVAVQPTIAGIEHNPQFAQVAAASDLVLVANIELTIGTDICNASLSLPFNDMFQVLERSVGGALAARDRGDRDRVAAQVRSRMGDVPVDVAIEFGATRAYLSQIVGLSVGDVLPLRHKVGAPLTVTSSGITFGHAVPGAEGKRLVCQIIPSPEEKQ